MIYEIWAAPILFLGLGAIILKDIQSYRIPDSITIPLILAGLFLSFWSSVGWVNAMAGAVGGFAVLTLLSHGFERLKGYEGLGQGDAKLLAVGGAWCGGLALPMIVLIASLSGLLFAGWRRLATGAAPRVLPFAPFLGGAIGAVYLYRVVSLSA